MKEILLNLGIEKKPPRM